MARFCPQCGEIHFETTASPLPPNCRKCNADMNEASGLLPRGEYEEPPAAADADPSTTPPPKAKPKGKRPDGLKGIIVGGVVLAAAGVMIYLGTSWNLGAKETTGEVTVAAGVPKDKMRDKLTARYTVGTKTYHMYPGLRRERETFTIYYLPDDPGTGYEMRPFFTLLIGGKVLLIGLAILTFGVIKLLVWRARVADYQRTMATAGA